jgi:hypothetical protein
MKTKLISSTLVSLAIAGALAVTPLASPQGLGNLGKKNDHAQKSNDRKRSDDHNRGNANLQGTVRRDQNNGNRTWNPAPPKQNGRHDNRDWNKNKNNDHNRDWHPVRNSDNRNRDENWNHGTSNMRVGHADGQTFRIPRRNGGTGARPVYNYNAPINRPNNSWNQASDHRQSTKNEWRNIAIGAGAVALLGLLQHDNRLVFAGSAGALYSLYRYEQDRKSQNKIDRARAAYFGQPYFVRDGKRYDRRLVTQNGERYYQFVCH